MRRIIVFLLVVCIGSGAALAGGLDALLGAVPDLPDPKDVLLNGATLYMEGFQLDDGKSGIAYAYPMPEDWTDFLKAYTALCTAAGYTMEKGVQLNKPAWQIVCSGLSAWLIPEYSGCLLLVVDREIPFQPIPTPVPTPTPKPTPVPKATAMPTQVPDGHWEYIEVEQDCFACVNGVCDLCNGTGTYRMYGASVSCSRTCETCDGRGYWITKQAVWVYDR